MMLNKLMWFILGLGFFVTLFASLYGRIELRAGEQVLLTLLGIYSLAALAEAEDKTS